MVMGWREPRPFEELLVPIVIKPTFSGFETCDDRIMSGSIVFGGVLVG
jgi:hypothetical protein